MRPTLDYHTPEPGRDAAREPGWYAFAFWCVYSVCAFVGLGVLNTRLHTALAGRPGDLGVLCLCSTSIVVVTVVLLSLYGSWLRRVGLARRLVLAAVIGSVAFLPPYALWAAWYLLFSGT